MKSAVGSFGLMVTSKLALMCHRGEVARRSTWKNFFPLEVAAPPIEDLSCGKCNLFPFRIQRSPNGTSSVISTSGRGRWPRTRSTNGDPLRKSPHRSATAVEGKWKSSRKITTRRKQRNRERKTRTSPFKINIWTAMSMAMTQPSN